MGSGIRYPETVELNNVRLAEDWTFDQLADDMDAEGYPVNVRTLHYLIRTMPKDANPQDRTLYKIRKYLEAYRLHERQKDQRRRRYAQKRAASSADA